MDGEENIDESIQNAPNEIIGDTRGEVKTDFEETEKLVEERKKKLVRFFKSKQIWVLGFLIIAIILGVYIRYLPMADHGGNPGLWDITTNTWTLGPDLDPWLFTRYAEIIVEQGSVPKIDMMRNVPLGFDISIETQLLSYMISWTYYLVNLFGNFSVIFAAAIFPVIMFALTIISFFLFVREIFIRKTKESITKANVIALISSFFMIVIPIFLSRTIAGIPEKESAGFFFMFLAFYLFLKAWKVENFKNSIILAILAGISTGLMGLIWGGVNYIFITIALSNLIAFILNKIHKKEFMIYLFWIFPSFLLLILFSNRFSLKSILLSLTTGSALFIFLIFLVHFILWETKFSNLQVLKKLKIPKNIISLILSFVLLLILSSIFLGPSFLIEKGRAINKIFFRPVTGRWAITVAENRQPYFTEWGASFGPFIKNIPVLFWMFFVGSIVLFKKMLDKIKNKDAWILTGLYILFFLGLVFSRYSAESTFNGENFISKFVYFASAILLIVSVVYFYIKYYKIEDEGFEDINYDFLFLFSLFVLCLISARGAVRVIMVLAPIAPIFVGYLIVESVKSFRKVKDETWKIILGLVVILILLLSIFAFWGFYKSVKGQAYGFVPSSYNQQWQKAMEWVREETPPTIIENVEFKGGTVFAHWWDYGYWVQSIGNRATVLDGGNVIGYWNYLMGRLVLTGDNQKDALEFLYNHNTTHLLIDSTDIGKYTAFSSIGSDIDYDRYSWIGTFFLDEKQTQETKDQITFVYSGGIGLDEDLIIEEDGKEILLPKHSAGIGAMILPSERKEGGSKFSQPYIIVVYQGRQHKVDLRYLSIEGEFVDFGSGIEATTYIFPTIMQQNQGINSNPIGAVMYLSPRLMRGMLSQIYILDDPLNNFPNFKLVHSEPSLVVDSLNSQGMNLPEIVYYQGIQGPIKIWEIEYTGEEKIRQEYLDTKESKYINWVL